MHEVDGAACAFGDAIRHCYHVRKVWCLEMVHMPYVRQYWSSDTWFRSRPSVKHKAIDGCCLLSFRSRQYSRIG